MPHVQHNHFPCSTNQILSGVAMALVTICCGKETVFPRKGCIEKRGRGKKYEGSITINTINSNTPHLNYEETETFRQVFWQG